MIGGVKITKKIGFIGLGVMGKPMAKNLVEAGYELIVYDIVEEKVKELEETGAESANSCAEVADEADVIILMLPDSEDVKKAMNGEEGVLEGLNPDSLVIDMSSISPLVDQEIEEKVREKECKMIDAPVSGGEEGAIEGELAIMIGGVKKDVEEVLPMLEIMGKNITRIGEIGAGQFTKLVNQILVGVHLQAMSEAMVFAEKGGLDLKNVYEAVRGGLAGSQVMDDKIHRVLERNYEPGFRIELHIKDLKNALETARNLNIPLPTTSIVKDLFLACAAAGREDYDHGGLITATEDLANIKIGEKK